MAPPRTPLRRAVGPEWKLVSTPELVARLRHVPDLECVRRHALGVVEIVIRTASHFYRALLFENICVRSASFRSQILADVMQASEVCSARELRSR